MGWSGWIIAIFIGTMLALLIYSVISTSIEIRKKAQPLVDTFFDGVYSLLFHKSPRSKHDKPRDPGLQ